MKTKVKNNVAISDKVKNESVKGISEQGENLFNAYWEMLNDLKLTSKPTGHTDNVWLDFLKHNPTISLKDACDVVIFEDRKEIEKGNKQVFRWHLKRWFNGLKKDQKKAFLKFVEFDYSACNELRTTWQSDGTHKDTEFFSVESIKTAYKSAKYVLKSVKAKEEEIDITLINSVFGISEQVLKRMPKATLKDLYRDAQEQEKK